MLHLRCAVPLAIANKTNLIPFLYPVVQLRPNELERQKYNEIVAQIKTNLIASRGSGPDSFFHPANRKYAQRALTNLILYCFHFTPLDREQRELWYVDTVTAFRNSRRRLPAHHSFRTCVQSRRGQRTTQGS